MLSAIMLYWEIKQVNVVKVCECDSDKIPGLI